MREARILRLNTAGQPIDWLHWQQAVCLYARGLVCWDMGGIVRRVKGGRSRFTGLPSTIDLPAIIACHGKIISPSKTPPALTNAALFARDNYQCLYCGHYFGTQELSRDHVHPSSRGGLDRWENVVCSCKRCNQRKGNDLLSDINMELLALPFRPNPAEYLALVNNDRIRADQIEFLKPRFSQQMRLAL